ncbi:MAG: hypothetical protein H6642_02105 [Caldilineaceae bacterium]|nr:hypothetical protein [Caldilineaceae bacterium]
MAPDASSSIQRLRALAHAPEEQAARAVDLVQPSQPRDVLSAALDVLTRRPVPDAREPLRVLYAHILAKPEKRDPGGYLRRPLLDALRRVATPADAPLFLGAITTYERYPPTFQEEAGLVRAAGLIALNEVDEELAALHAARLLADLDHTDAMSGEPAAGAASLLAAQGRLDALYLYATLPPGVGNSETTAACLRNLISLPVELLPPLVQRYAECTDPVIMVGLFDLLFGHEAGVQGGEFIIDFLAKTRDEDLYHYLVVMLITGRNEEIVQRFLAGLRWETHSAKRAIARDALELRAEDPAVAEALARLSRG